MSDFDVYESFRFRYPAKRCRYDQGELLYVRDATKP